MNPNFFFQITTISDTTVKVNIPIKIEFFVNRPPYYATELPNSIRNMRLDVNMSLVQDNPENSNKTFTCKTKIVDREKDNVIIAISMDARAQRFASSSINS